MRVEKKEVIFLSQNESDTWTKFSQILEGLERECEDSDIIDLVQETQCCLNALWDVIDDVE